jgi:peptidoglycan/LPS O-acetylase OafA/YrhL
MDRAQNPATFACLPHTATRANSRLAFLDVARGLAVLLVVTEHAVWLCIPGYLKWSFAHVNFGRVGVVLFLLVSGCIIPDSLEQGRSISRFWLRRFFRLFPAYWLSIVLGYAYCRCGGPYAPVPWERTSDWLLNLTMLQGLFNRPHVWGVFWTLQLELVTYAGCTLLFAARLLGRPAWVLGLALGAYLMCGLAHPLIEGKCFSIGGPHFLYFAPLIGMVARGCVSGNLRESTALGLVLTLAVSTLMIWLANKVQFPADMTIACLRELTYNWGLGLALFFLLFWCRGFSLPGVACWLGTVSYSIYLLHPLVLVLLVPAHWPPWAFLSGTFATTLLLAAFAHRFVEAPGIALGRSLEAAANARCVGRDFRALESCSFNDGFAIVSNGLAC